MVKKTTIVRLFYILEKINSGAHPDFETLRLHLENHDILISHRTLQRDIESLRNNFGVEIIYNRTLNSYQIDHEISNNVSNILLFMSKSIEDKFMETAIIKSKKALNHIYFEDQGKVKGFEFITQISMAILKKRKISFTHYNFQTEKENKYVLHPYLLKQYQNRWYVVGKTTAYSSIQSFGLDRIYDFKITSEKITYTLNNEENNIFKNTIGLTYDNESEFLVLEFRYPQAHYVKTLPWHESQETLKDDGKLLVIKLNLVINFELKQKILSFGSLIKVNSPKWLAYEIKKELKKTIKNY